LSYKDPQKPKNAIPWTGKNLLERFTASLKRKENWVSLYREAMQYVTPQREAFYQHSSGDKRTHLLYDNTAQEATEIFASRIMATMTPSWQMWSHFRAGSDIPLEDRDAINKELVQSNKILFDFINHSNFTSQATETYMDLCFGTGAMLIEDGGADDLLVFTNVPLNELYLEEGPDSTIQTVYRWITPVARNLEQMFPNAEWSDATKRLIKDDGEKKVDIILCSVYDHKSKLYYQVVLEKGEGNIAQHHAETTSPFVVPRWAVTSGEIYGRGPAIKMLPTIKTLNKMSEFQLRHAAMAVAGAYTAVSDGVINPYNLQIKPNTIIPVAAQDSLQPLQQSGNPDFSNYMRAELRQEVKDAFLASPMPDFDDAVRSATEMSIRNSEMLKNAGAQLGRLKSEMNEPIIARCVDILRSQGKMPDIKVDGREVSIKHTSPLAKIEDQEDLQGLQTYFGFMEQAEVYSQGITALSTKIEDLPAYIANKVGGFEELIRTKKESSELAQSAMEQEAALAEQQQQAGQTVQEEQVIM
jgi:hypothetical protein